MTYNSFVINKAEVKKVSEHEKQIIKELDAQLDKLTPEQRERLSLIAQGMALEADRVKKNSEEA